MCIKKSLRRGEETNEQLATQSRMAAFTRLVGRLRVATLLNTARRARLQQRRRLSSARGRVLTLYYGLYKLHGDLTSNLYIQRRRVVWYSCW